MKNQITLYHSRVGYRFQHLDGRNLEAANRICLDGKAAPGPLEITEDTAFYVGDRAVPHPGVQSPSSFSLRVSRDGPGTLSFSGPFRAENAVFQALEGKTLFLGDFSAMGMLVVNRHSGSTPVVEISGIEMEMAGARVGHVSGELHLTQGAVVNAATGLILGNGTFLVSGAGSCFIAVSGLVHIGANGTGSAILTDGGRLSAPHPERELLLGQSRKGHGILNIGAPFVEVATAPGILDMNHIDSGEGEGTIVFNHTALDYAFTTDGTPEGEPIEITGAVDLIIGSGVTTLYGANRSVGASTITGGTLLLGPVREPASALGKGSVAVGAHGKLGGAGLVNAETVVWGVLSPANGPEFGRLDFHEGLNLMESATAEFDIGGIGAYASRLHDSIKVEGALHFAGELRLNFVGGFRPQPGDFFFLFDGDFTAASNFCLITFVQPGYAGVFNELAGILTITAVPVVNHVESEPRSRPAEILAA